MSASLRFAEPPLKTALANRSMRPSFWKWGLLLVGLFFLIDGFIPNSRAAAYDPWSGVGIALLMFLLFAFSCMVRLK